jgi:hypothetical protein
MSILRTFAIKCNQECYILVRTITLIGIYELGLGRMVGECGIIKPSSEMKEGEEMEECQERILNETDIATTTQDNER